MEKLASRDPVIRKAACDALANLVLEHKAELHELLENGFINRLKPYLFDPDLEVCIAATGVLRPLRVPILTVSLLSTLRPWHSSPTSRILFNIHDMSLGAPLLEQLVAAVVAALDLDPISLAALIPSQIATLTAELESKEDARIAAQHQGHAPADDVEVVTDGAEEDKEDKGDKGEDKEDKDRMDDDMKAPKLDAETAKNIQLADEPWRPSLTTWRQQTLALQTALEILTNICSTDDILDLSNAGQEDMPTDEELAAVEVDADQQHGDAPPDLSRLPPAFQIALHHPLLQKLLQRSQLAPQEMQALSAYVPLPQFKSMISMVQSVAHTALTCLNNLLIYLPTHVLGDTAAICNHLFAVVHALLPLHDQPPADDPAVTPSLAAMEAALKALASVCRKNSCLGVTKEHLKMIVKLCRSSTVDPIRLHSTILLGVAANSKTHLDFNFIFGTVLLEKLNDSNLAVVAESLDALFDLFSEDYTFTDVIQQIQLLQKLRDFNTVFAQRIKNESRSLDPELAEKLKESRMNLVRFIKYKSSHQ
eukprot:TRINITY_DN619_c0_g1_i1.p1 TRINITY_DN619_c0_g1~~TRINITY_DN619_c0_g1_i1.p1  ORF type:complete len:536 (-),score=165.70 TRINITY_DN619_c0_g1_i1:41-1648(-)